LADYASILKRLAGAGRRSENVGTLPSEAKGARELDAARLEQIREVFRRRKDASLEELLQELIAVQDGIRPEDVTVDYIQHQREKRFYPSTRYDIDSKYGGYDSRRMRFLSRDEFDSISDRVDAELARLKLRSDE
jgi:hypothetical protein